MADRILSACEHCGQVDDHPKVHVGTTLNTPDVTYHHDCLPAKVREQVVADDRAAAIVIACEGGLRGSDLLDHILTLHKEG